MKIKINKNISSDFFSSLIIAFLMTGIFTLSGTTDALSMLLIYIVAALYIVNACIKTRFKCLNYFTTPVAGWYLLFSSMMFFYGFFGEHTEEYSLIFHFSNIIYVLFIGIIMYYKRTRVLYVFTTACKLTIIFETVYLIINDLEILLSKIGDIIAGNSHYRFGETGAGNVNLTAMAYVFMLIPILYEIRSKRNLKLNYILLIIGLLVILLTGSKKGIIGFVIILICLEVSLNKTNALKWLKGIGVMCVLILIVRIVPLFYNMIWTRMETMIQTLISFNITDEASTSMRMKFITTALQTFWDKPLFGHGWYSFAYESGFGYYTHCNFTELLFNLGLVGLVLYYLFPIFIVTKCKKTSKQNKVMAIIYLSVLIFFDTSAVTFYSSNLCAYIGFSFLYMLVKYSSSIENIGIYERIR